MYQAGVLLVAIYIAFVTVTNADECQDKFAPLCFKHKRLGHCSDSRWARNLKNLCQKTCNFCSGKKECVDVNQALCQQRKMRGECDQPSYFTLNMCKKTCDFCSGHIKTNAVIVAPPADFD